MHMKKRTKGDDSSAGTKRRHVLLRIAVRNCVGVGVPAALYGAASTWGIASTGTAIASLSGAAQTSATLALIGKLATVGMVATGSAVFTGGVALVVVGAAGRWAAGVGYKKALLMKRRSKSQSE